MIRSGEKVLVAISGGKDSATLLHILYKLSGKLNFKVYGFHLNVNTGEHSSENERAAVSLFNELGIKYKVVSMKEIFGDGIAEISKKVRKPACSVCGLIKRYITNYVALYSKIDKIATGHHLDDVFSYIVKSFIVQGEEQSSKLVPYAPSFDRLVARIKPLIEVLEIETSYYAKINNLPVTKISCPFKHKAGIEFRIKEAFPSSLYKYYPLKVNLVRRYAKQNLKQVQENSLRCKYCGIPSTSEVCSFCKLLIKLGIDVDEFYKRLPEIVSIEN